MAKATTLVAQLSKVEKERQELEAKEDQAIAERPIVDGKVWVRLIRPHLDANGQLHEPGIVALDPDFIPKSAKVLTRMEAVVMASGVNADELLKETE